MGNKKFLMFLESMKVHNPALVESIKSGFNVWYEGIYADRVAQKDDHNAYHDDYYDAKEPHRSIMPSHKNTKASEYEQYELASTAIIGALTNEHISVPDEMPLSQFSFFSNFDAEDQEKIETSIDEIKNMNESRLIFWFKQNDIDVSKFDEDEEPSMADDEGEEPEPEPEPPVILERDEDYEQYDK